MLLDAALYLSLLLVSLLSIARARRDPRHRPIAWLFGTALVIDIARRTLRLSVLDVARASMRAVGIDPATTPFTGLARLAFHVHTALTLTWGFAVAAVAIAVLLERRARWVWLPFLGTVAAFSVAYPWLRQERLEAAYVAVYAAQTVWNVATVVRWLRPLRGRIPGLTETCALAACATHAGTTLVLVPSLRQEAWLGVAFTRAPWALWWVAQGQYLALYGVVAISHLWSLWGTTPPPSSPPFGSSSSSSARSARSSALSSLP